MEEMRLRNGAISSYNLSPRYHGLNEPGVRTPLMAPLTPHHHHHRRASFGTPYSSDLLSVSCFLAFAVRCIVLHEADLQVVLVHAAAL
jgi:hypothetical protein